MISTNDRLLIVAKMIVNDMDEIARLRVDAPVFFGMGQALNRVYSVLRGIPIDKIGQIVPMEMMKWIRDQPVPGVNGKQNTEQLIKLVN